VQVPEQTVALNALSDSIRTEKDMEEDYGYKLRSK